MNRRTFIKTAGAFVAGTFVLGKANVNSAAGTPIVISPGYRLKVTLADLRSRINYYSIQDSSISISPLPAVVIVNLNYFYNKQYSFNEMLYKTDMNANLFNRLQTKLSDPWSHALFLKLSRVGRLLSEKDIESFVNME